MINIILKIYKKTVLPPKEDQNFYDMKENVVELETIKANKNITVKVMCYNNKSIKKFNFFSKKVKYRNDKYNSFIDRKFCFKLDDDENNKYELREVIEFILDYMTKNKWIKQSSTDDEIKIVKMIENALNEALKKY